MFRSIIARIQTREAEPFWSLTTAFIFTVAYIIVYIAAQAIAITLTGGNLAAPNLSYLPLGVGIAGLINAAVILRWVAQRATSAQTLLRLAQTALPTVIILLISLASAYLIDLIGVLTRLKSSQIVPPTFEVLRDPNTSFVAWAVAVIVVIIVQPLGEGLTFHGLFYPALATRYRSWVAILGTAALFTLVNLILAGQGGVWYAALQPFLMMVVVGMVRAYTQSTRAAILARAMFGLFFVLSALLLK